MGTKTKTSKRNPKIIIAICLALALLAAIGVSTFAWIRNYVAVEQMSLTTGKMLYKITLYQKDANGVYTSTELYDTGDGTNPTEIPKNLETQIEAAKQQINVKPGEEVFFVVEKYPNSIDLDVSLAFEKDGDEDQYKYMGQTYFVMKDISSLFDTKMEAEGEDVDKAVDSIVSYYSNRSEEEKEEEKNDRKNMNAIWETVQKTRSLDSEASNACIRLAFVQKSENQSPDATDSTFPLNLKFCVSQKGAKDDDSGARLDVTRIDDLSKVMESYGFNDEIYITGVGTEATPVEFDGDLVFTRPCKIILNRSYIKVNGNLIFSYAYDGEFSLDTISDGHIGVSGNFQIDLPNSKIDLLGANNAAAKKADVYVGGSFVANASRLETRGLNFKGMRVCADDETLKPLKIMEDTRLTTTTRTQLGKISVVNYGNDGHKFALEIDNKGSIEQIDLTNMKVNDTLRRTPTIFIDNSGTIVDPVIRLPGWSEKFVLVDDNETPEDETDDEYAGNTRIIANKGSSKMYAVTTDFIGENGIVNWPKDSTELKISFISNRDKDYGHRDDIEYAVRDTFIEVLESDENGNATSIVIHYEVPSEEAVINNKNLVDLVPVGTENIPLSKYLEFYGYMTSKGGVLPITLLNDVKIICYGDKVLDGNANNPNAGGYKPEDHENDYLTDDYACIRKMENLETLDLSDAVSKAIKLEDFNETHKTVPEGAFRGMSKLSKVLMSESDTAWGKNLFVGTQVDEITFPQALVRLLNTMSGGTPTNQDVLTGIKYVYTSITKLSGLCKESKGQYFFTPDTQTYEYYRSINSISAWRSKVFINNGVVRQGENRDIFLRYDPETSSCEFVVYTGNSPIWMEGFDFKTFSIDGKIYDIVSYDPYAVYGKLSDISQSIDIEFGEKLEYIGRYAFAVNTKIQSVTFSGNTVLKGNVFQNNTLLESVNATEVTTIEGGNNFSGDSNLKTFYMPKLRHVGGGNDLNDCSTLERVDISVIEYTTTNKTFYPSSDAYSYAAFYIHTDNLSAEAIREIKEGVDGKRPYSAALAADYRHVFVNASYAYLYHANTTYTGVTDIGNNSIDDIKSAIVEGVEYYYVLNGSTACLVACLDSTIDMSDEDAYDIPETFDFCEVNKIGSAAYHFTEINAKSVNVPDSVVEIGQYAFDAEKAVFEKRIGTLNLSNVVKVGKRAFYSVNMLTIDAPKLEEAGEKAFSANMVLLLAVMPKLEKCINVFEGASALRVSYVGFSNDTSYDEQESLRNGYVRVLSDRGLYIDNSGQIATTTKKNKVSNVNTIVNSNFAFDMFSRNRVSTDSSYSGVHFSDFYNKSHKFEFIVYVDGKPQVKTMELSVSLPGYVFYENGDGTLTLFAVSPDISVPENYTTPGYLNIDPSDRNKNKVVNTASASLPVTKIGKYAYGVVSVDSYVDCFTIAPTVIDIEDSAFRGAAVLGNTTNTVLNNVTKLDLNNVETVGASAFYQSSFSILISNKVREVYESAFFECKKLSKVELPSFEKAMGTSIFQKCTSLREVILGENAEQLSNNMFDGAANLEKITLLGDENSKVVSLAFPVSSSTPVVLADSATLKKVHIYVHGGIYQEYLNTYYTSGHTFGGIPKNNFHKYGDIVDTGDVIYYLNKIDENTAYIDYIEFESGKQAPTNFTIPGMLSTEHNDYTIVAVSPSAILTLSGVEQLTLPSGMQYLTFTAAALPDTVKKLVISADNKFFMTDANGVLYSKDGTILYAYPKAREADSFTVNSSVEQIFDEAFYGAKRLKTITIAGSVVINDRAFDNAFSLVTVDFTSATASMFAGSDIFGGIYSEGFKITVPGALLEAYKENVLIDYSIVDKIKAR